jgi:outer membrane protein OmpA-like peptidoglycan-associated protein
MSDSSEKPSPPPDKPVPETVRAPLEQPLPVSTRAAEPAPNPVIKGMHGLWTLIVRLAILGVGVGLGWIAGVLVAQVFPARNPEPPLQEIVMRQASQTTRKLQQLPQWWRGEPAASEVASIPSEAATTPETVASAEPEVTPPPPLLPDQEAARLSEDLSALQQDLDTLEGQLVELESRAGLPSSGTLEVRLSRLEQSYRQPQAESEETTSTPTAPETDTTSSPPASGEDETASALEESASGETGEIAEAAPVYQEPRFSLVTDRVVLPSSLLFEPAGSTLTPTGQQLLNTVVPDLRRYPGATFIVGSHTDDAGSDRANRELTFQQSLAVQQYLEQQLGDDVRWVAVGYGNTRPRVQPGSTTAQQRNQRVEIGIVSN